MLKGNQHDQDRSAILEALDLRACGGAEFYDVSLKCKSSAVSFLQMSTKVETSKIESESAEECLPTSCQSFQTKQLAQSALAESQSELDKNSTPFEVSQLKSTKRGALEEIQSDELRALESLSTSSGMRLMMPSTPISTFGGLGRTSFVVSKLREQVSMDKSTRRSNALQSFKVLLSSEKTIEEIARLSFNPNTLSKEIERIARNQQVEDKSSAPTKPRRSVLATQVAASFITRLTQHQDMRAQEKQDQRLMLGFGMSYDDYAEYLSETASDARKNQLLMARLIEVLKDMDDGNDEKAALPYCCIDWYSCYSPDSVVVHTWTVVYCLFMFYLATYGLYEASFDSTVLPQRSCSESGYGLAHTFQPIQWFDASVDLFFVLDVLCRCMLFGVPVDQSEPTLTLPGTRSILLVPSRVFHHYVRNGMLLDVLCSVPIQWIVMMIEAACLDASRTLLIVRTLRVLRVARVYAKVLCVQEIRAFLKKLSRKIDNNSLLPSVALLFGVLLLIHFWACITWIFHSLDSVEGFYQWEEHNIHVPDQKLNDMGLSYSLAFLSTLEVFLVKGPYVADTSEEAGLGVITSCLSVIVFSLMFSKILEVWQNATKCQSEHNEKMTAAMQYLRSNGINGELRENVLDYCDYFYSNQFLSFERMFLDELSVDLQARMVSKILPKALDSSPMFKGACDAMIARLVVLMARRPVRAMPGLRIVSQGTFGDEMYFIKCGSVEVTVQDQRTGKVSSSEILNSGSCFGEVSLWMDIKRIAMVKALTFCDLYILTRSDFNEILHRFPENKSVLASFAIAHLLRSCNHCPEFESITMYDAERIGRVMGRQEVLLHCGEYILPYGTVPTSAWIIRSGRMVIESRCGLSEAANEDIRCLGFTEMLSRNKMLESLRAECDVVLYRISFTQLVQIFTSIEQKNFLRRQILAARARYWQQKSRVNADRWSFLVHQSCPRADVKADVRQSQR